MTVDNNNVYMHTFESADLYPDNRNTGENS